MFFIYSICIQIYKKLNKGIDNFNENHINFIGTYNSNKIYKNNMYKLDFNDDKLLEKFMIKHNISKRLFFYSRKNTRLLFKFFVEFI